MSREVTVQGRASLELLKVELCDGCGLTGTNRGRMLLGDRPGIDHSWSGRQDERV